MEISSCCGAPVIVEYQSDVPHCSDDEYDLKVPVWLCSLCGAVITERTRKDSNQQGGA